MPVEHPENKKVGKSLLWPLEQKLIKRALPGLPLFLNGKNLTLVSLFWSGLIVLLSYYSQKNIVWLGAVSGLIILQWITDSLDGAIGRYRNSGLVRWGYVMDHFLDYVFLASVFIGYSFLISLKFLPILMILFMILAAFMVCSFLVFGALREMHISYARIGATEIRLVFVFMNILFIFFGPLALEKALLYLTVITGIVLVVVVYNTQRELYEVDKNI